ncbi:MAG: extracellular solute-binding protein [Tyzzerella sp.]|nr:extracellular solute-binding protein [Tyzzerella sp.]
MKKKSLMALGLALLLGLTACGGSTGSTGKPKNDTVTLQFWGWGDDVEASVFQEITDQFNETVGKEKNITVKYVQKASSSYSSDTALALSGNHTPDIVYVEDKYVKSWADAGYLAQLDSGEFSGFDFTNENGEMWESGISRYRFDSETATSDEDASLWALPKDIGPTVLYYNSSYLKELGITEISVAEEELDAYNTANGTSYLAKGYDADARVFNNRIAMAWDEVVELAKEMQKIDGCDYGYYNEWWYAYGWSVGGDVVEYMDEGYYKFTLNDKSANYIVKDDVESVEINGTTYKAGELISYTDKAALKDTDKQNLNELPSMYDAFLEFVALTAKEGSVVGTMSDGTDKLGYGVSMGANSLGTADAEDYFISGKFGMFVDGRWEVPTLRENMSESDKWGAGSWNVAPLPVYKEYDASGNVTVHGVAAGHSGSVGLAIADGSENKEAAFEFLKFVAGEEGQKAQSLAGFAIPNQTALSNDEEIFLQTSQDPANAIVFVEAAAVQRPGDWWSLTDSSWIDDWANYLNYTVRENKATVNEMFDKYYDATQEKLYKYTGYSNE